MIKRILFLTFFIPFLAYSKPIYLEIKPVNSIRIKEDIPYKSDFFYVPEKEYFVFSMNTAGFIVYNKTGNIVRKHNPPSQSPGFLLDLENFIITKDYYYAVDLFNIIKLDKNFNFIEDFTRGNALGGSVCWINGNKFYCVNSYDGLVCLDRKGSLLKRNSDVISKRKKNTLSYYFNRLRFYVTYPFIYILGDGSLVLFKINLKTFKTIYKQQLPLPENFKSAFKEDKKVYIGMNFEKYLKETQGYARVWAFYVSGDYLFVAWKITAQPDGFVDIYSIKENKILYHLKIEDTEETIYHRMTFNPEKPVLFDYDYIEVEDGNDYGLIRVYDLSKFLKR